MNVEELLGYGHDQAVKSRVLARECQCAIRDINEQILELIEAGIPVAASGNGNSGGYFITETREEAVEYIEGMLKSRIIKLAKRMRDYKRAARPILNPGQLPLL